MSFLKTIGLSEELYNEIQLTKNTSDGKMEGISAIKKLSVQDIIEIQDETQTMKMDLETKEFTEVEDKFKVVSMVSKLIFPQVAIEDLVDIPSVITMEIDGLNIEVKNMDLQTVYIILNEATAISHEYDGKSKFVKLKTNRKKMLELIVDKSNIKIDDIKKTSTATKIIDKFAEVVDIKQLDKLYDYFYEAETAQA